MSYTRKHHRRIRRASSRGRRRSGHVYIALRSFAIAATVSLGLVPQLFAQETRSLTSESPTRDPARRPLVLAHYMPWFSADPASGKWGWHWTMDHFDPSQRVDDKRAIAAKYYPTIGPYDSGDRDVLEHHLLLMKLCGISGVIVDWYGLTDFRDYAELHRNTTRMLEMCERLKMKFVICYEDQTIPALVKGKRIASEDRVGHAAGEIAWLGKYWFKSPSYVRLDGMPVMLSFGHAGLTNEEWGRCQRSLSFPVRYFSQDIRRDSAAGVFGWPSPENGIEHSDRFLQSARQWPLAIPAVFPRFDDVYAEAGVRDGFPIIADADGETLKKTLRTAMEIPNAPVIQIATWNDWGEGTQIEPSRELGKRDLKIIATTLQPKTPTRFLDMPYKILKLRRHDKADTRVDQVVALIAEGAFEDAESALLAIESPTPQSQQPLSPTP